MEQSFLEYAMSVITARTCDAQGRSQTGPSSDPLVDVFEKLEYDPTDRTRKCATVVGDVIGNYHPHGG